MFKIIAIVLVLPWTTSSQGHRCTRNEDCTVDGVEYRCNFRDINNRPTCTKDRLSCAWDSQCQRGEVCRKDECIPINERSGSITCYRDEECHHGEICDRVIRKCASIRFEGTSCKYNIDCNRTSIWLECKNGKCVDSDKHLCISREQCRVKGAGLRNCINNQCHKYKCQKDIDCDQYNQNGPKLICINDECMEADKADDMRGKSCSYNIDCLNQHNNMLECSKRGGGGICVNSDKQLCNSRRDCNDGKGDCNNNQCTKDIMQTVKCNYNIDCIDRHSNMLECSTRGNDQGICISSEKQLCRSRKDCTDGKGDCINNQCTKDNIQSDKCDYNIDCMNRQNKMLECFKSGNEPGKCVNSDKQLCNSGRDCNQNDGSACINNQCIKDNMLKNPNEGSGGGSGSGPSGEGETIQCSSHESRNGPETYKNEECCVGIERTKSECGIDKILKNMGKDPKIRPSIYCKKGGISRLYKSDQCTRSNHGPRSGGGSGGGSGDDKTSNKILQDNDDIQCTYKNDRKTYKNIIDCCSNDPRVTSGCSRVPKILKDIKIAHIFCKNTRIPKELCIPTVSSCSSNVNACSQNMYHKICRDGTCYIY